MDNKNSYTSADAKPIKLIQNPDVLRGVQSGKGITPVHVQVILTNRCNLNCAFCSCAEEDRAEEMSYEMAVELISILKRSGTKAVTITGGGEPLLHPQFEEIICEFFQAGIKIGLVTNGTMLGRVNPGVLNLITWIRISHSSDRLFNLFYQENLKQAVSFAHLVDWAFSFVVTEDTVVEDIIPVVEFANTMSFTHVRLVSDLFHPENIDMGQIAIELNNAIDDNLVIYQPRQQPERGSDCYIGYLKPLISANGMVYACCGVQYAFDNPSKKLPIELCLGSAGKLEKICEESKGIDGSICSRCYYGEYNRTLKSMIDYVDNVNHKEFV